MSDTLDLITPLRDLVPTRPRAGALCVIWPDNRPDCCGVGYEHPAQAWIKLGCGHEFTYCRHALVILYGRCQLRYAMCPHHSDSKQIIVLADWLG